MARKRAVYSGHKGSDRTGTREADIKTEINNNGKHILSYVCSGIKSAFFMTQTTASLSYHRQLPPLRRVARAAKGLAHGPSRAAPAGMADPHGARAVIGVQGIEGAHGNCSGGLAIR